MAFSFLHRYMDLISDDFDMPLKNDLKVLESKYLHKRGIRMLRYGTVGTSWITETFINSTRLVDGMELSAVFSRDAAKGAAFAEKNNAQNIFIDIREMASSPLLDAVYIASPNSLHYEQSKLFLENGKHVLCEKPACATSQQLADLQALARAKGLVFLEAIMMVHLPQRILLKKALGKIGAVSAAHFGYSQRSSKLEDYLHGKNPNIFNPEFATGCLMDLGVYCVYPALDFFGAPKTIVSTTGLLSGGSDGFGNSLFVYEDKQVALSYSKIGQGYGCSEIIGQKGTITIQSISRLTDIVLKMNDGTEERIWGEESRDESMSHEAKDFLAYILNREKNADEYDCACQLSLAVAKTVEEIKRKAIVSHCGF